VLSEYCGDGIINGPEQCDPGTTPSTMCAGCRRLTTAR
jgi:cysteine-rich repeat protein